MFADRPPLVPKAFGLGWAQVEHSAADVALQEFRVAGEERRISCGGCGGCEAVSESDGVQRLDVRCGEHALGGDVVQCGGGAQSTHDERGFVGPVTTFDLVGDLADVDPAHPRTFSVKGALDDRARGLVAVQPGEDRP
jgi:hypothetical protein